MYFFLTSPGNNYREDDYEDNSYSNHAWNEGRGGPRGRGRGRGRGGRGRGAPGFRDRSPLGGRGELPAYAMHAFMCPLDFTGLLAPVNYNAVLELKFRDFMKLQREFLIIMAKKYWDVRIVMFGLLLHFFFYYLLKFSILINRVVKTLLCRKMKKLIQDYICLWEWSNFEKVWFSNLA